MDSLETEEDMRNFLQFAYDMDEETVAAFSKEELQNMIQSLNMSMNIPGSNKEDEMEVQSLKPDVIAQSTLPSMTHPVAVSSTSDGQDIPSVPMEQNEGEEAIITEFCECTGSDRKTARHLLECVGFELESAIPLFFSPESPNRTHPGVQIASSSNTADTPHTFNALDGNVDHVDGGTSDFTHIHSSIRQMMQNSTMNQYSNLMHNDDDSDGEGGHPYMMGVSPRPRVDRYDEDGIRLPDRAQTRQLVHHNFDREADDVLARAEDPTIEWMFPTPRHLSYMGSLEQARDVGNRENRWILVNIQSHQEFTSQLLNRDVWTNDTIESLFRTSYLFWQRGHTTKDGKDYMMMHKIKEDDLPHIGFIDPRTGAKKLTLTGLVEANDLAIRMIEFIDANPLNNTPPPPPSSTTSGSSPASFDFNNAKLPAAADVFAESKNTSTRTETSTSTSGIAGVAESKYDSKEDSVVHSYGEVPLEPQDSPDAIKVSIKLINGKTVVRRFLKTDKVSSLFAVVLLNVPEAVHKHFDIVTRFPVSNLSEKLNFTLAECDLAGSQVLMKWL